MTLKQQYRRQRIICRIQEAHDEVVKWQMALSKFDIELREPKKKKTKKK